MVGFFKLTLIEFILSVVVDIETRVFCVLTGKNKRHSNLFIYMRIGPCADCFQSIYFLNFKRKKNEKSTFISNFLFFIIVWAQ